MQANLSETASKIFKDGGNCAQAIYTAYGEQQGLGSEMCLKIASSFSGGIAHTGNVCGALTFALMVIGLKYGGIERKQQEKINDVAGQLLDEFKSLHGSILCRELINYDLITTNDIKQAFEKGVFNNCPKFVADVSMILDKLPF